MRKMMLSVRLTGEYGSSVYGSTRHIADIIASDEQLASLSVPLGKIAAGAVLEGLDYVEKYQGDKEQRTDKAYTVKVELGISKNDSRYVNSKMAEVEMAAKLPLIEKTSYTIIALGMEKLEEGIIALCYDILVANKFAQPMVELTVGEDATRLAALMSKSTSARDVADQIEEAMRDAEQAESRLCAARTKLREVMAGLETDGAQEKQAEG